MIQEALNTLVTGRNLDYKTVKSVMNEITQGLVSNSQTAAFLTALKMKGETVEEITAAAEIMKEKCIKTELSENNTLDIVGTGGDMSNTFNISTASAFAAAAGGVPIAKHGNRAQSSKSGAADVLEALGININLSSESEKMIFNKLNICFLFAQNHHPAMKFAAQVRKELKFRTLFNILGPLTNPAGASSQLFGVYDEKLVNTLAQVISNLGVKNVLVVHGKDGIDEASVCSETIISEGRNAQITNYTIQPEDFGLRRYKKEDLQGGSPKENAQIILNIFSGKEQGAKKDIVVLNTALALYTYKKTSSIQQGIILAQNILESGMALDKLNKYIKISNEV